MHRRSPLRPAVATLALLAATACGGATDTTDKAAPSDSATTSSTTTPTSTTTTTTTSSTTTTAAPEPTIPVIALADAGLNVGVVPPELSDVDAALWLAVELGVDNLVIDNGAQTSPVFAVEGGVVTPIETGTEFVGSDGRFLTITDRTPGDERARFLTLDGTVICEVDGSGGFVLETEPELIVTSSVQTSSTNSRLVYYHPYDFVCGSGEVRTIYPERIDAPDFWQESHDLVRVGEREFLRKLVQNSAPTTNEEGVRIDGRDQTSRHTFTPDGEVLVHRTTTLRYPDISRVQARETAEGELLWEVVVDGPVDRIVIAGDTVLIRATDAAGFDGIATIDLVSGELIGAVATTYRLVGAA